MHNFSRAIADRNHDGEVDTDDLNVNNAATGVSVIGESDSSTKKLGDSRIHQHSGYCYRHLQRPVRHLDRGRIPCTRRATAPMEELVAVQVGRRHSMAIAADGDQLQQRGIHGHGRGGQRHGDDARCDEQHWRWRQSRPFQYRHQADVGGE